MHTCVHKYIHIYIYIYIDTVADPGGLSGHGPHIRFGNRVCPPPRPKEKMLVKKECSSKAGVKTIKTGIPEDNWVKRVDFGPPCVAEVKIPQKWSMIKKIKGYQKFWWIDIELSWQVIENEKFLGLSLRILSEMCPLLPEGLDPLV